MKKEMKRTLGIVLSAVTVLSIGATSVFAAGSRNGRSYNDADGDGACDNRVTATCVSNENCPTASFVDENIDGVCDNRGSGKGQNAGQGNGNFVDEDNDGVCDNRGTCKGCGKGYFSK